MYSPPFTNNPFVSDPTNAQARYPDISANDAHDPSQWNPGYPQQQQQQHPGVYSSQQSQSFQQQPQYSSYPSAGGYPSGPSPIQSSGSGFQPSSSFGQQLMGNISGSSYGYLTGQQPQQQGYGMPQNQLPDYLSQFDPMSSGWDGQQRQQQQPMQNTIASPSTSSSYNPVSGGNPHPREFVQKHKAELETWDEYSWKQTFNSFDTLKDVWDKRKTDIDGNVSQLQTQLRFGGGGFHPSQLQQEIERLQGLRKEAESNSDSVAASLFQMREVFAGYRQSTDTASKRRVRESCNAALQSLPDWPSPTY